MLHIIKLAVGVDSVSQLVDWQGQRLKEMARSKQTPELMHVTRNTPKRAGEVLDGGSLYWVINGWIAARQRLLELRPVSRDGMPYCGLVYDKELVRVQSRQHRPFQGWRYLNAADAPRDLTDQSEEDIPDEIRREMIKLGIY